MEKRRIVITGIGVVAPNGIGKEEFWSSLAAGNPAIGSIRAFDAEEFEVKISAEVRSFDPLEFIPHGFARKMDRFSQFGYAAAKMALNDSGIQGGANNGSQVGVCIGSGLGGLLFHEEQIERLGRNGPNSVLAGSVPKISPNSVSSYIAIGFGLRGPNLAVSTACSSGANAIGVARDWIRSNRANVVIAGGVEAPITRTTFSAYSALKVLSKERDNPRKACRPFDKNRDGFVLGEGGGIVVMESLEYAIQRSAKIYAEVIGFSSNCGAYHMVTPDPSGNDAASAMADALKDADLQPEDIDYINAHGTGTTANDLAETRAIKMVFGSHAMSVPISSVKAVTGHAIGAAGAIECIASILSLHHQVVPPTANYEHHDPECDLDHVLVSRPAELHTVMSNSFGFGSNNAVLILKKWEDIN